MSKTDINETRSFQPGPQDQDAPAFDQLMAERITRLAQALHARPERAEQTYQKPLG